MFGTLLNVLTVLIGASLGLLIRKRLSEKIIQIVFQALGLFTLFLGISMALKTQGNFLLIIFSLITGGIIGELFQLEKRLNQSGDFLKKKIGSDNQRFTEGLVTTFILFCIGPMTMLGAIQEGLGQSSELLVTKAIMDGFSSIALAAGLGIGVLFSVIPLLLFQGGITLLAQTLEPYLSEIVIAEMSAVGGIMLMGLAINILEIKKLKITNMLPSLFMVILLAPLFSYMLERLNV